MRRSAKRALLPALVAGTLALGGCDSDDDGGGTGGTGGMGGMGGMGGNPDGGMGGPDSGTPPVSGDVFAIAARLDGDDPAPLDRATLQGQLDTLLGEADADDPLAVEDDDTALSALQRRRDAAR